MRAVQLVAAGKQLEERDIPRPSPEPGEILIEVAAAGICHSDAHYRAGFPSAGPLPLTLGHEIAGTIADIGAQVEIARIGDRVCVHYQVGCGHCSHCLVGHEQFCSEGSMIGKARHGGYAEFVSVPQRNVFAVPDAVSLDHASVMMCSSATALHALRKGRLAAGERVAVFGAGGGLGLSAVQLARSLGAAEVYAVDLSADKTKLAASLDAIPVDARAVDPVAELLQLTEGGVDVALDLVGSATVVRQALDALAPMGRVVAVGLTSDAVAVGPYTDLVTGEHELIGTSDHLATEIPELLTMAESGDLVLNDVVTGAVPLEAAAINGVLDALDTFSARGRTVIRQAGYSAPSGVYDRNVSPRTKSSTTRSYLTGSVFHRNTWSAPSNRS